MSALPVQVRQAQDGLARRLFFDLLDGTGCDLEGLGAGTRRKKTVKAYSMCAVGFLY
ncbi:hypothetical protein [Bacillus timonensis]|uniref:hypothetical protein n=1 Tax=Bacillus timonensis TaxID=1033734 RepID=UPI0002F4C8DB|nr:hypothetical protein [Bacillus timonensis]